MSFNQKIDFVLHPASGGMVAKIYTSTPQLNIRQNKQQKSKDFSVNNRKLIPLDKKDLYLNRSKAHYAPSTYTTAPTCLTKHKVLHENHFHPCLS